MKKNILLISSFFESPFHKNRAPYNEQLFLQLKSYFDIKIIRPVAWTDIRYSSIKLPKKSYYRGMWNEMDIYYPTYYFLPRIALPTNGKAYYHSIRNSFKHIGRVPDIFYTTWAYPDAYATMLLAKKHGKKYLLRVHGSDINDLAFRKNIRKKVSAVLDNASAIISPSEALKEKMLELNISEKKIHVIYSGIDKNKFYYQNKQQSSKQLGLEASKKRVLYIGNFKQAKGVLDLLEAVKLMKDETEDFEVLFIGKGEDQQRMQAYIKNHELEPFVKIIGPVDHHLLNPWINSSDCVCLPSYAEGLPNVLLEALACNTNIVATNVGGIPEIIKNAPEYLLEPGDIGELKNKLSGILSGKIAATKPAISIKTYKEIAAQISEMINRILSAEADIS